jgi:hypothetical protein
MTNALPFRQAMLALTSGLATAALAAACSSSSAPVTAGTDAMATDDTGTTSEDSSTGGGQDAMAMGSDAASTPEAGSPIDASSKTDSGKRDAATDSGSTSVCSVTPPTTITLPLPSGGSGTWVSTSGNGDLTGLAHPSSSLACTVCHESCATLGSSNTIIGYDHSDPNLVCNYCHDPGTKVVNTSVTSGSMANYHSSSDSQVCTCCHNGTNNTAHSLPAEPATPIVPSSPACTGTSAWQLVFPALGSSTNVFSGGQFFDNE